MNDVLSAIAEIVFFIFVAIAGRYLVPLLRQKLDGTKYEDLAYWVGVAVKAAEQTITGGADKKAFVLSFLRDKGLDLDADKVDALIEAAVYALKGGGTGGGKN